MWKIVEIEMLITFQKKMADRVSEYVVKTKYGQSFDFVYIEKEKLSFENYIETGKYWLF